MGSTTIKSTKYQLKAQSGECMNLTREISVSERDGYEGENDTPWIVYDEFYNENGERIHLTDRYFDDNEASVNKGKAMALYATLVESANLLYSETEL